MYNGKEEPTRRVTWMFKYKKGSVDIQRPRQRSPTLSSQAISMVDHRSKSLPECEPTEPCSLCFWSSSLFLFGSNFFTWWGVLKSRKRCPFSQFFCINWMSFCNRIKPLKVCQKIGLFFIIPFLLKLVPAEWKGIYKYVTGIKRAKFKPRIVIEKWWSMVREMGIQAPLKAPL